ncbi:MAG: FeoB-associated Cys-rich membrane protein [Opitutales bacterium]
MGTESLIVGAVILLAVLVMARHFLRVGRKSGCGCGNCPARRIPARRGR